MGRRGLLESTDVARARRRKPDLAGVSPPPRLTLLLVGLLTGIWLSTAAIAGNAGSATGDACRLDRDCTGYLRCLERACAVPPAVLGGRDAQAPGVEIVADGVSRGQFLVELATDSFAWERGLSFRPSMAHGWGMLFMFPRSVHLSFTMRLMRFPLDIVFIDDRGEIVDIIADAQPKTPVLVPASEYRYVLELNAGAVRSRGIRIGDSMQLAKAPRHREDTELPPIR